mmetsp:Transcript_8682/g.32476  ORF Transcript_8682/g.32476 Transcript_8682/m.32476 type:complete len:271 (-) Transcript_8682:2800-3612(-)
MSTAACASVPSFPALAVPPLRCACSAIFAAPSPRDGYRADATADRRAALTPSGIFSISCNSNNSFCSSRPNRRCSPSLPKLSWSSWSNPASTSEVMFLSSAFSSSSPPSSPSSESEKSSSRCFSKSLFFALFAFAKAAFAFLATRALSKRAAALNTSTASWSRSSSESSVMPSSAALLFLHSASAVSLCLVCWILSSRFARDRRRRASATAVSTVGNAGNGFVSLFIALSKLRYRCLSPGVTNRTLAPSACARPVRPDRCTYVSALCGTW